MSEEQYIVSARKYRPATFRTVVGQKTLTNTLKNAIESNRLAQAYLFCGPRGVGKTSCARIFAKTINCQSPTEDGEACGVCESCRAIDEGNSYNLTELDAASNNGIDDMKSLIEQVNTPPQVGKYRVFIIDEVHMLSTAAFNAFLKTLEEPPSYAVFILATTEKHKVIPTILSRCQIYDFKRITIADMVEHLSYVAQSEGIEAEKEGLGVIARKADGAMRDALSIFDQVAASSRGHITYQSAIDNLNVLDYEYYFRLVDSFRGGDVTGALLIYSEIRGRGFDSLFFVNGLANHVRDMMLAASPATLPMLEQSEEIAARYATQATQLPLEWYYAAIRLLSDCDLNYRTATDKRLLVELTLIRLCQLLNPPAAPFDRVDDETPLRPIAQSSMSGVRSGGSPSNVPATPSAQESPSAPSAQAVKVAQPSVRRVAPPARSAAVSRRPQTMSLSSIDEEAKTEIAGTRVQPKNEAFSEEDFRGVWGEYMVLNPQKRLLGVAMRAAEVHLAGTKVKVTVDNPSNSTAFNEEMRELTMYLRDRLRNDSIEMEIELVVSEKVRQVLAPKEFLSEVTGSNPVLRQFLLDISAEMV